ncbi:uncharacterized protein J3R85_006113 [Psidium guajava]|nr:uncharacterized protein J3R85_006113 [Psidium guajava]
MSGVWVFKNGVIRLENPQADVQGCTGQKKALEHLPTGEVISSYSLLERILGGLGWEQYSGRDPDLLQFHKQSSIDLISLPETSPSSTPFTCTTSSSRTRICSVFAIYDLCSPSKVSCSLRFLVFWFNAAIHVVYDE